jgi:hypothetical protein
MLKCGNLSLVEKLKRPNCKMPFPRECLVSVRDAYSHSMHEMGIYMPAELIQLGDVKKGDYVETQDGYDKVVHIEKFDPQHIMYPLSNVFALRCTGDVCVQFGNEWMKASEIALPIRQRCNTVLNIYTEFRHDIVIDGVTCIQPNLTPYIDYCTSKKPKNVCLKLQGITATHF